MILQSVVSSALFFCILVLIHGATEDSSSAKKKPKSKCNGTSTDPVGKVEFNGNNASINCNFTLHPPENGSVIHLLLQKLILDDGDQVRILGNDSELIFPPFHAREDAILLVTDVKDLVIVLLTSPRVVQREFAVSYHAQACTFTIDDNIPAVTHPIYAPNSTKTDCDYIFEVKTKPNITFAFSFESFNLSVATIQVTGAAEGLLTFSKESPPHDFISGHDQVTIVASFDPEHPSDEFVLKKRDVYAGCSHYISTNAMERLISPPLPSVLDSSLPTECVWHVKNSIANQALGLKFKTLHFKNIFDVIAVCDGPRLSVPPFLQITYNNQGINLASEIRTSASEMIISFNPVTFASNFTADVFNAGDGRYMKDNGTLRSSPGRDENATIFLLEVADGQNVVLNFKDSSFASPASLNIYEGFSTQSKRIATLYGNVWYPVISPTSRMMLAASDFKTGHFEAEFSGSLAGCMHMSPGSSDSYILSGHCNSSCSWIIPPIDSKDDLHLHIQYTDLQKDDLIQILDRNKMIIANITVNVTHVPEFSFKSQEGAYVKVTRGACPKKEDDIILVAHSSYLPSCSRNSTLSPYKVQQLTSPNYPNTYPLLSHCKVNITRSSPAQLLHVAFSELDLAPNHCIKVTQIMKNGTSVFDIIGNQMPEDFLYVGDIVIEFNAESCDKAKGVDSYMTKQGFVINMTTTDCGGVFEEKKNGKFSNDGNKSLCIWMVRVPAKEKDGSVNIITYTTTEDKTGNHKFTVYDGSSVRSNVIENSTESEIWSTTNALIFVYERLDLSKPSSKITVNYETKNCDKSMQCENNLCMHPDWKCNGKNDCGDFSDERNCAAVPTEKMPPPGIKPVVFGICGVLFFFVGVAVTLLTPWAIQKYRNRYHQFSDLSVIE